MNELPNMARLLFLMAVLNVAAIVAILYFSDKSRRTLTWTGVFLARSRLLRLAQSQATLELLEQIENLSRDLRSRRARARFAPIWEDELEQAEPGPQQALLGPHSTIGCRPWGPARQVR